MTTDWMKTIDLCRYYRRGSHEVKAVDNVSLGLQQGDYLSIVGASGSGKSTILNLMAGLDTPTSGRIEFDGTALSELSRRELATYRAHRIGMVFQSFNLVHHRSALGNVELALYFNKTPRRERAHRATEILEKLGLGDRLDHRPADLSGGEQQRVALARALVKSPDLLLADEPTGNLDQENTVQIAELLNELNLKGLTIVMVTHDLMLAEKNAHRVIRMDYGRLVTNPRASEEGEES